MTQKHYSATFSNGKTITRTSEREYKTAGAYINQETGEMSGETFSAKTPTETRTIYETINPRWSSWIGYHKYIEFEKKAKAYNAAQARIWKWEIVTVEVK